MVIAGKIRGNAPQLGRYLFTLGNNERITILHLDGREDATVEEFKDFLYSVELNSELTRSRNSAYHAYINPDPEDTKDRVMTKEEWMQTDGILTKHLNYEDQRHGAVLHDLGNGRVHVHIVYERYNHERGAMATYEHNFKAHDRARAEMEQKLNHKPTPQKNENRAGHKQALTEIWKRTNTAEQFIKEAKASGFTIAKGTDRPFKVIDADGVSFDLVRKLDGVKTCDVKALFGDTELLPEKTAIHEMQSAKRERMQAVKDEKPEETKQQQAKNQSDIAAKTPATGDAARAEARQKFLQQAKEVSERNRTLSRGITYYALIALRLSFLFRQEATKPLLSMGQQIADSAQIITANPQHKPPESMLGFIEAAQFYKPT